MKLTCLKIEEMPCHCATCYDGKGDRTFPWWGVEVGGTRFEICSWCLRVGPRVLAKPLFDECLRLISGFHELGLKQEQLVTIAHALSVAALGPWAEALSEVKRVQDELDAAEERFFAELARIDEESAEVPVGPDPGSARDGAGVVDDGIANETTRPVASP